MEILKNQKFYSYWFIQIDNVKYFSINIFTNTLNKI